jgi:hypothetical protein
MPSTEFLVEVANLEHHHNHHSFENTDVDVAGPDSITEEEGAPTDEEEDSGYHYDSYDEAEASMEDVRHSYTDDQPLHQGIVISSLLSQDGTTSYDEFMTMFKNGSLHNSLSREATHGYDLGHQNRPCRPAADPSLVYH